MAHNHQFRRFVCHELFIFSPQGAQDSACLAHKSRICHFVCQSYPLPGRETAPGWHTNPDFTALCAKVSRRPAERQRRAGTQISFFPLCVPKLSAARLRDSAGLAHKSRFFHFVSQSYPLPGGNELYSQNRNTFLPFYLLLMLRYKFRKYEILQIVQNWSCYV